MKLPPLFSDTRTIDIEVIFPSGGVTMVCANGSMGTTHEVLVRPSCVVRPEEIHAFPVRHAIGDLVRGTDSLVCLGRVARWPMLVNLSDQICDSLEVAGGRVHIGFRRIRETKRTWTEARARVRRSQISRQLDNMMCTLTLMFPDEDSRHLFVGALACR